MNDGISEKKVGSSQGIASGFMGMERYLAEPFCLVSDDTVDEYITRLLPESLRGRVSMVFNPVFKGSEMSSIPVEDIRYFNGVIGKLDEKLTNRDIFYQIGHELGHRVAWALRNGRPDLWGKWKESANTNDHLIQYAKNSFPIGVNEGVRNEDDQIEELFSQVLAANGDEIVKQMFPQAKEGNTSMTGDDVINFKEQTVLQSQIINILGEGIKE